MSGFIKKVFIELLRGCIKRRSGESLGYSSERPIKCDSLHTQSMPS